MARDERWRLQHASSITDPLPANSSLRTDTCFFSLSPTGWCNLSGIITFKGNPELPALHLPPHTIVHQHHGEQLSRLNAFELLPPQTTSSATLLIFQSCNGCMSRIVCGKRLERFPAAESMDLQGLGAANLRTCKQPRTLNSKGTVSCQRPTMYQRKWL